MRIERKMQFLGTECRPNNKKPGTFYKFGCFLDGAEYYKPFISDELYAELSERPVSTPVIVSLDLAVYNGRFYLAAVADAK